MDEYEGIPLDEIPHADYPHEPGRLYDCARCEAECFCTGRPGDTQCIFCSSLAAEMTNAATFAPGMRVFCKTPDVTHGAHAIIVQETYVSPIDGEWPGHALVAWGLSGYELSTGAHVREHMQPDGSTCPEHFSCSLCRYPDQAARVLRRLGIDSSSLQV